MTNREQWEAKLHAMTDREFEAVLCGGLMPDGSDMQAFFGNHMCAWCEAKHGGKCILPDSLDCIPVEEYLQGEVIA